MNRLLERLAPFVFGLLALGLWQGTVWALAVPVYVVPGPIAIFDAYLSDYSILNPALLSTLTVTFTALLAATILGVILAVAMAASSLFRAAIQPWAVILQVTPVVAIAPLIILWVNQPFVALGGLRHHRRLLPHPLQHRRRAGRHAHRAAGPVPPQWRHPLANPVPAPPALGVAQFPRRPAMSGTLALVGAVVAEFVAGSGGFASGLAYRIIEASYRLEIPRMFAALVLLGISGIVIYAVLGLLERFLLRKRDAA